MDKRVKDILVSTVTLTLIGALCAAALAATNLLTKDRIAERQAAKDEAARQTVLTAAAFEEATLTEADGDTVTYFVGKDADGAAVGYVFTASTQGKNTGMVVLTGVDTHGAITGVEITEDNETAGYINKIKKGGLTDRMIGKTTVDTTDKISQATKTSAGVKAGVQQALDWYQLIKEGGEQGE